MFVHYLIRSEKRETKNRSFAESELFMITTTEQQQGKLHLFPNDMIFAHTLEFADRDDSSSFSLRERREIEMECLLCFHPCIRKMYQMSLFSELYTYSS